MEFGLFGVFIGPVLKICQQRLNDQAYLGLFQPSFMSWRNSNRCKAVARRTRQQTSPRFKISIHKKAKCYRHQLENLTLKLIWRDKKIFSKPRLIHLEQIYTWFILNWNDGLIELVESYIVETADKPAINVFFTNIRLLFGYYLPMVCYFIL